MKRQSCLVLVAALVVAASAAASVLPASMPLVECASVSAYGGIVCRVGYYVDGVYGEAEVVCVVGGRAIVRGWRPVVRTPRTTTVAPG